MVGFGDGDGRRVGGICCCKFCGGFGCEGFDAELAGRGFDGIGGSVDDVFGVESARGGSGWMRYSSGLLSGCCCVPDVDVLGVCGGACGCPLDCEGSSVGMLGDTVVAGVVPVVAGVVPVVAGVVPVGVDAVLVVAGAVARGSDVPRSRDDVDGAGPVAVGGNSFDCGGGFGRNVCWCGGSG